VPAVRVQSRRHKYMIRITKMRQKTPTRLSCGAILSEFSREFDPSPAILARLKRRFGNHLGGFRLSTEGRRSPAAGGIAHCRHKVVAPAGHRQALIACSAYHPFRSAKDPTTTQNTPGFDPYDIAPLSGPTLVVARFTHRVGKARYAGA
jgi:hypothetical protein